MSASFARVAATIAWACSTVASTALLGPRLRLCAGGAETAWIGGGVGSGPTVLTSLGPVFVSGGFVAAGATVISELVVGKAVAKDEDSYRYLIESIERFPDMPAFARMIEAAGFHNVKAEPILGGLVAIHSGWKI